MGLSAVAYETAVLTEPHTYDDDCYDNEHIRVYIDDPDFERSLRGLIAGRCYKVSGQEKRTRQSYGGYDDFRAILSRKLLGVEPEEVWGSPEEYIDLPFFELINFSDCEGAIGPEAAADLAEDFIRYQPDIHRECPDRFFLEKYDQWTAVMSLAAGDGLVVFC